MNKNKIYYWSLLVFLFMSSCLSKDRIQRVYSLDSQLIKTYDGFEHRYYNTKGLLQFAYGNPEFVDERNYYVLQVLYLKSSIVITQYILGEEENLNFDTTKSEHIIRKEFLLDSNFLVKSSRTRITNSKRGTPYVSIRDLEYKEFEENKPCAIEDIAKEYAIKLPDYIYKSILQSSPELLREALIQDSIATGHGSKSQYE